MGLVPRIEQRPRLLWALPFILALLLLAGTRPYENGVFAATICLWLAVRFLQKERRPLLGRAIVHVAIPVAIGALGILAAQLAYNEATTGNYRLMPYQIWRVSQDFTPMFLWQPLTAVPAFYHEGAARFALWNAQVILQITRGGIFGGALLIARQTVTFRDLLGPLLFLPFLCWSPNWLGPPATRERTVELAGAACVLFLMLMTGFGWPKPAPNPEEVSDPGLNISSDASALVSTDRDQRRPIVVRCVE